MSVLATYYVTVSLGTPLALIPPRITIAVSLLFLEAVEDSPSDEKNFEL
jgi:hypothetical protein